MHLHPLIPLTASLILGIVWQASGALPWLAILVIPLLYSFYIFNKKNSRTTAYAGLAVGLFFAGGMRYAEQQKIFESFYQATANKKCSAIAQITDQEESYRRPEQTLYTLKINQLTHNNAQIPEAVSALIQVATKTEQTARVGDTVTCSSLFFRQTTNQDYKRYLIKEQLGGHLYSKEIFKVKASPSCSVKRWFVEKRNSMLTQLKQKLSPTTFTLFASIFWGKKQVDPTQIDPIKEQFKVWGLLHYLARSGLHLLIFVLLWTWLMGFAPLPFATKQLALLVLIFGYLAISWSSISFTRAIILFILYKVCLVFDLQINALYLLALTCSAILLYNPYQLFFLDFQLSFGLTCALAIYSAIRSSKATKTL